MIDSIFATYRLCSSHTLLPLVKYKLTTLPEYKYKAIIICSMALHEHFDFEALLLPLLLEDKVNIIEKYLENAPDEQEKFVLYLDKMNHPNTTLGDYIYRYNVKVVHTDKLSRKQLYKLQIRLMKLYGINPELCPNVTNQKFLKNLRYLVYR